MANANGNGVYVHQSTQPNTAVAVLELAPHLDWSAVNEAEHFVQFYETDAFLLNSLSGFIAAGLLAGEACVLVATKAHRESLAEYLKSCGLDVAAAVESGQYITLDAAEILSRFMADDLPEPELFVEVIGGIITQAATGNRRVRIFGEMVALLWEEGKPQAAIRLEELWNELHKTHPFLLFCAYPMNGLGETSLAEPFSQVCRAHSHVIPAESYTALTDPEDRLRAIVELQQQANSLQAEIAERKMAEEALRQANQRKDEFLAMLAHELRNPLAPIRSAVQVLQRLGPQDPQLQHAREIIARQTEHLTRLVDDLLDTSRIDQGKITLRKERLELRSSIGRALETSRHLIEARKHQLHVSLPPEPLWLEGDSVRLAQVISNLLNNAAKYTEPGGQIWLIAERAANEIVLRVRDTGIGISPTLLPHIFDLFTQAEQSLDRSEGGLGIGLALVRSLVELHGGRVEAFSAGQGQGCEFVVHLPLLAKTKPVTAPASAVPVQPSAPKAGCRVLVVDDNVDSAECLALLLQLSGHAVEMAHDGPSALDLAQTFQPQVVLLDIGLPEIDGYEVVRRLRERPEMQKTVFIALTGYGRAEDQSLSKQAGFNHHLVKPIDPTSVEALISSLVLE